MPRIDEFGVLVPTEAEIQRSPRAAQRPDLAGLLNQFTGGVNDFLTSEQGQIASGLLSASKGQFGQTGGFGSRVAPAIQNVLNQQAQRGLFNAQSINQLAQAGKGPKPQETFTPLTDAEEKQLNLDTSKSYQRSDISGKVSQIGGGGVNVDVNTTPKLDRATADVLTARREAATSGRTAKRAASRAKELVESEAGINVGIFAPLKDAAARLLDVFATGDDATNSAALQSFANSQSFDAQGGILVGQIIKLFGSGTGLSDADREFAIKIAGALRSGTKEGLLKILNERISTADRDVKEFNKLVEGIEDPFTKQLFPAINTDDDIQSRIDAL
jgi:hypothetical protein